MSIESGVFPPGTWSPNEIYVGSKSDGQEQKLCRYDLIREGQMTIIDDEQHDVVQGIDADLCRGILISGEGQSDYGVGCLRLYSKNDPFESIAEATLDEECNSVFFHSSSNLICAGTAIQIEIWDLRNMRQRVLVIDNVGDSNIEDIDQLSSSSSWTNDRFVSGSVGGDLSIWNPVSGKLIEKIRLHDSIFGVRVLPSPIVAIDVSSVMEKEDEEERIGFLLTFLSDWNDRGSRVCKKKVRVRVVGNELCLVIPCLTIEL